MPDRGEATPRARAAAQASRPGYRCFANSIGLTAGNLLFEPAWYSRRPTMMPGTYRSVPAPIRWTSHEASSSELLGAVGALSRHEDSGLYRRGEW
jgi:hypothetical protein